MKSIELRNAYTIKYSKGGHYFFAIERQNSEKRETDVAGSSSNIYIYNAYTYVLLKRISIRTSKVFSLVF